MYKLFTDINKQFTADVDVQGAPLSECKARIILESDNINLLYHGKITSDGKCNVNIGKLKNILRESEKGKIRLEIIAEDTLFTAWESDFIVETKKKIKITEVIDKDSENSSTEVSEEKPSVKIKVDVKEETDISKHIKILESEISKRKITSKDKFNTLLNTYKNITTKRNVLTESEFRIIEKELTSKYFN